MLINAYYKTFSILLFRANCNPGGIDLLLNLLFVLRNSSFTARLLIK
jgi:hypothetical protein